jgi:hypothetical protein
MGRFKKTDQIFAHLNTTLLNSNVLRGRNRPNVINLWINQIHHLKSLLLKCDRPIILNPRSKLELNEIQ